MVRQFDVPGRCSSSSSKSCDEFGLPPLHAQALLAAQYQELFHHLVAAASRKERAHIEVKTPTMLHQWGIPGFREEARGGTVYGGENSPR
jgi:hypothetical protein